MSTGPSSEIRSRLARLRAPSSNGSDTDGELSVAEDLDWFLFHSFPDCEVLPDTFAELVPVYERALRAGARFDYELLFVRVLELEGRVGDAALRGVARAAMERVGAGGFEPADGVAAVRFALRVLPADDGFLAELLGREDLAAFRFHWTLDFVLDERELAEYLALSYLRDEDPATAELLRRFPVPEARLEQLGAFFAREACRVRLEEGWTEHTSAAERPVLAAALVERLGRLDVVGGTSPG